MSRKVAAGEETKEKILEVSLALFASLGFAGTTTRMVASRADVNVATIAYHFGGKQGLYDTVVQRLHAELMGAVPPLTAGPPGDVLRGVVRWLWQFSQDHRVHIRLLIRHVLDHEALPEVVVERWTEPLMERGEGLVAAFRPEWDSARRRLFLTSNVWLFARFAIEDPAGLRRMGVQTDEDVVDWLTEQAATVLGIRH